MARKSGPPPIVYILLVLLLAGAGYWFFFVRKAPSAKTPVSESPKTTPEPVSTTGTAFSPPASVSGGTVVRINGSTSMVQINQNLKKGFEGQFPGTTVATNATGSDEGIRALLAENIDVAASSRPLTSEEQNQGLAAVPIGTDAITVVISEANPFRKGLTQNQVMEIFQGQITNWSAVGGSGGTIQVINRPPVSGTYQVFRDLVLKGANFGSGPNFTTLPRDATTPLLQALKTNGIGYATYSQIADQLTVRAVAIEGLTPEAQNYPYKRTLYYVYKQPPSEAVQAFLGYATSSQGKQILNQ